MNCDCKECKKESWIDAVPGFFLTILVLAAFVGGVWGIMLLWNMER